MASESPLSLIAISLRERLLTLVRRTDSEDPLHPRQKPASLVYDVDDRPPLLVQLGVSIQHLFLMFTSWIYVVVIVNSVGGTAFQAENLIRVSMIAAGVATILQSTQGILGSGYLCPLSCSLTYLPSSVLAANAGGFPLLFGMVAFAGATLCRRAILSAPFMRARRRTFGSSAKPG